MGSLRTRSASSVRRPPFRGAIDGPFHGERLPAPGVDYQSAIAAAGIHVVTDRVVTEWLDVVHALSDHPRLAHHSLGYLGLSMGSRFGVAVAASLDRRLHAAVLGKFGVRDSGVLHPGLHAPAQILAAARGVRAPVLFHVERFDEVFLIDDQVDLFDAFVTTDKSMLVREGAHGTQRPEDERTWLEFLASHLRTCP